MYKRNWAICIVIVGLTTAISASQNQKSYPIYFLGTVNESGFRGAIFCEEVGQILMASMNATNVFTVKDAEVDVTLPLNEKALTETAKSLKTDFVSQAIIKEVQLAKTKGHDWLANVVLEVSLASGQPPYFLYKTQGQGNGQDTVQTKAVAKAVQSAANEISQRLNTFISLKGQVILPQYDGKIRITLDMDDGLSVGSEVVILRDNKPIAFGTVIEVDAANSQVKLNQITPDVRVRIGDQVRVSFIPARPAKLPFPLEKEREYKRVEHHFGWALVIAGAIVAIVGE